MSIKVVLRNNILMKKLFETLNQKRFPNPVLTQGLFCCENVFRKVKLWKDIPYQILCECVEEVILHASFWLLYWVDILGTINRLHNFETIFFENFNAVWLKHCRVYLTNKFVVWKGQFCIIRAHFLHPKDYCTHVHPFQKGKGCNCTPPLPAPLGSGE